MKYFKIITLIAFASLYAKAYKVVNNEVILNDLKDYNKCQADDYSGRSCHDALERWVKDHPADAFEAGKITRLKMNAAAALPFFTQAFSQKNGDCKDEQVELAVVGGLSLPDYEKDLISQAKKIGFEICFSELKEAILKEASLESYIFKNACKELIQKKALTGLKEAKCKQLK